jgi:hypothetical protein
MNDVSDVHASPGPEAEGRWSAGLLLFSGRPNPSWTLTPAQAEHLLDIWNALPRKAGHEPAPSSRLGYGGAFLSSSQGEKWLASRSCVIRSGPGGEEIRDDPQRRFGNAIRSSAPDDIPLPDLDE